MAGFQPNTASAPESRAKVVYGSYDEASDLFVNQTVKQVRHARGAAWSIPSDAKAYRGREQVSEDYQLKRGDVIEFIRRQGDKG
jgi:hypothetical protein